MLSLTQDQVDILTAVRDSFPSNEIYLGGSTAISSIFPQIIPQDLDIFVIGSRSLTSWAQKAILETWADHITETEFYRSDEEGRYLIPGQEKFWRIHAKGLKIDVICLKDDTDIFDTFSCDISKIVFRVGYGPNVIGEASIPHGLIERLLVKRRADIYGKSSTDAYIEKCEARAKLLGITLRRRNGKMGPLKKDPIFDSPVY